MSQQSPDTPSPTLLNSQNVPLTRPEQVKVNVQAELQHIRRIVNGANKRLERLCNHVSAQNQK